MGFKGPFLNVIKIQLVPVHNFLKKMPGELMHYKVEVMGIILSRI